jgi:hypothetical protein
VFQGQHGGPQQIFVKFSRFHAYFLNKIMLWRLFFLRRMFKLVYQWVTLNWLFFMLFHWFSKSWEPHVTRNTIKNGKSDALSPFFPTGGGVRSGCTQATKAVSPI